MDKKAQLIIDMPENCGDCYFHQSGEPDWCDLHVTNYRDIENENIRQEWCPLKLLKPLPKRKEDVKEVYFFNYNHEQDTVKMDCEYLDEILDNSYKRGYNACLDDIEEENGKE